MNRKTLEFDRRTVETNQREWTGEGLWEAIWRDLLPPGADGHLLDIGCAVHCWSCSDYKVIRCDQYATRDQGGWTHFKTGDINGRWPYGDQSCEGVIAVEVLEHIENVWHFYREAARVARRFVLVTTPNVECQISRRLFAKTGHLFNFSPEERERHRHISPIFGWQIEHAAEAAGWRIEHIGYESPDLAKEPLVKSTVDAHPELSHLAPAGINQRTLVALCVR